MRHHPRTEAQCLMVRKYMTNFLIFDLRLYFIGYTLSMYCILQCFGFK